MSTQSDAVRHPGPTDDGPGQDVEAGDLVLWGGRLAFVDDVARFAAAGTFVTVRFVNGKGLPVSLQLSDLAGCQVWHRAPGVIAA